MNDYNDDDLEVVDLILYGIPRKIYIRSDHFHDLDELNFHRRFRLTKNTVLSLLEIIEDQLEYPMDINNCVSPINQILVFLRYCATGSHLMSIADFRGMHVSTASRIIKRVSHAIASLYNRFITFPRTRNEIKKTQNDFFDVASFPNVIGVIDCTHVKVQSPGGQDAEAFRNRKQYFSINVQAICNANLEFINVVARWPGSTHDATIFNNSNIRAEFEQNHFENSILLGDSGYPVKYYLMTPLLNPEARPQQLYNESLIRTRNLIERCFGVVKRRFPVLAYGCRLKIDTTLAVITATCVLHNIARRMGDENPPPLEVDEHVLQQLIMNGQIPQENHRRVGAAGGILKRNSLINNYFARL